MKNNTQKLILIFTLIISIKIIAQNDIKTFEDFMNLELKNLKLEEIKEQKLKTEIDYQVFLQYIFFKQWAELKKYASELMTERTKQEVENVLYKSFSELNTAQTSHQLLSQNIKAAQENLRIQQLSFKEGMGTATQVIDAQNALNGLKTEMAINAYKYILSLATLLQSYGSIDEFKLYVNQPRTDYIR